MHSSPRGWSTCRTGSPRASGPRCSTSETPCARGLWPPVKARPRPHRRRGPVPWPRAGGRRAATRNIGRRLAHLAALAWRRVDDVLESRPPRSRRPDPSLHSPTDRRLDDEVIVMRDADPRVDPEVALRAAAEAALAGLLLGSNTATHLADTLGELPEPWAASATRTLVDLLTSGPGLVPVWDELDYAGVIDHWLPEWADIRLRGSSSPVHRYTIDRHSTETCVKAAESFATSTVPTCWPWVPCCTTSARAHRRPQRGRRRHGGRHRDAVGVHGERRSHDRTAGALASAAPEHRHAPRHRGPVHRGERRRDRGLRGVPRPAGGATEADARATGPSAWSSWRRGLVQGLIAKVREVLAGDVGMAPESYEGSPAVLPDARNGNERGRRRQAGRQAPPRWFLADVA